MRKSFCKAIWFLLSMFLASLATTGSAILVGMAIANDDRLSGIVGDDRLLGIASSTSLWLNLAFAVGCALLLYAMLEGFLRAAYCGINAMLKVARGKKCESLNDYRIIVNSIALPPMRGICCGAILGAVLFVVLIIVTDAYPTFEAMPMMLYFVAGLLVRWSIVATISLATVELLALLVVTIWKRRHLRKANNLS